MTNGSSRKLRVALGASLFALILSADTASAQYYYPYGGRSYGYDRRDDFYGRRPMPPRDMDLYLRYRNPPLVRGNDDDDFPRSRKPKRAPVQEIKNNGTKPLKGPYQIVISINHQSVSLYGADGLIRQSKVSTGMRGHPTPTGVFTVIGKEIYHRSNIYSGAPMPLMQRITWSGVAMHQGVLPGYPASHGCIRLTGEFAQFLYKTTRIGARVIIAHDDIGAPVEISNAKLPVPVAKPTEPLVATLSDVKVAALETKNVVRTADVEQEANDISPTAGTSTYYFKQSTMRPRSGPVSVFVSRKTGNLYVRHAYAPLFDMPVNIQRADQPLGTHVFTAMEANEDGKSMRWVVTSIPTPVANDAVAERKSRKNARENVVADISTKPAAAMNEPQTPANALERIDIPKEAAERISEILAPGSTFMISDYGISDETGLETDFIVLTR